MELSRLSFIVGGVDRLCIDRGLRGVRAGSQCRVFVNCVQDLSRLAFVSWRW